MITRKEYEKLPKPPEGMWLTDMQDMADELKKEYMTLNTDAMTDAEVEKVSDGMMQGLVQKATKRLEKTPQNLNFLSYTYWACMEEAEEWDAVSHMEVANEEERELRAEAMLRTQVLAAWLWAVKGRIEDLGGKIEV